MTWNAWATLKNRFECALDSMAAWVFHVINKRFFLKDYQYWTLTRNDPALIEIPAGESYDVNDEMEFHLAEAAYLRHLASLPSKG